MIAPGAELKIYIATRPVDFRCGHDGLASKVQEMLGLDPFSGAAFVFQHPTYALRRDTISYPWHPLFGMELQVAPFRRGKQLKQLITDQLPGYSREAPLWMFDAEYCGGMTLGSPEASIDGLTELAKLLTALRKNRKHRASSPPSK